MKLKSLVTELRQDWLDAQLQLRRFQQGVKGDFTDVVAHDKEEMKENIDYLTGENLELQMKLKQVCLAKAALQQELAQDKGLSISQQP